MNDVYHPDLLDFGKPNLELKPGFD